MKTDRREKAAPSHLPRAGRFPRALVGTLGFIVAALSTLPLVGSPGDVSAAPFRIETLVGGTPTATTTASFGAQSLIIGVAAAKPTATPTATATPTGTSTPTPTPTPTPTSTPSTATPTPTSTSTPSGGNTEIAPNNSANDNPGATLSYSHVITNTSRTFDYKNVTASSSLAWTISLFQADGVTSLSDNNSDGIPDTGRVNSGQSATIIVKIVIPVGALAGAQDVTTVTASSGRNPSAANSASATDTTTANGVLSLTISVSSASFGAVSPTGDLDPSATGVSSYPDAQGSYYILDGGPSGAVRVRVSSNGAWSGGCWADENTGTAATIRVGQGYLQWTQAGVAAWAPLDTTAGAPPYDNACFPSRGTGDNQYDFDYRLRITWTDDPGSFSSVVTYAASQ